MVVGEEARLARELDRVAAVAVLSHERNIEALARFGLRLEENRSDASPIERVFLELLPNLIRHRKGELAEIRKMRHGLKALLGDG